MMTSSMRFRNSGSKCSRSWLRTASAAPSNASGPASAPSMSVCEPMLLVMMRTVFLKSTVRPCESVRRPSSRIWSRTLKTSGCAFSISSNSTTW
jgi:hypothetical protein